MDTVSDSKTPNEYQWNIIDSVVRKIKRKREREGGERVCEREGGLDKERKSSIVFICKWFTSMIRFKLSNE